MNGIFLAGTDTDIGKTYVAALLVKKLMDAGEDPCYYKAALSGAVYDDMLIESDAKYVCDFAGLGEDPKKLVSFSYQTAGTSYLAALMEGSPFDLNTVRRDFNRLLERHRFLIAEGSGGVVCPLSDDGEIILIADLIRALGLDALVVAGAGLGTINHTVLTCAYLAHKGVSVRGIILNHFDAREQAHRDNLHIIERLTGAPVLACVQDGDREIEIDTEKVIAG